MIANGLSAWDVRLVGAASLQRCILSQDGYEEAVQALTSGALDPHARRTAHRLAARFEREGRGLYRADEKADPGLSYLQGVEPISRGSPADDVRGTGGALFSRRRWRSIQAASTGNASSRTTADPGTIRQDGLARSDHV